MWNKSVFFFPDLENHLIVWTQKLTDEVETDKSTPHFLVMDFRGKVQNYSEPQWPHLYPWRVVAWICNNIRKTFGTVPGMKVASLGRVGCFDSFSCIAYSSFTFSPCVHLFIFPLTATKKARPGQPCYVSNSRGALHFQYSAREAMFIFVYDWAASWKYQINKGIWGKKPGTRPAQSEK